MAWTQADLDRIKAAIATGAMRVELPSAGTVTYRSLEEMRSIQGAIEAELGVAAGRKPVRRVKIVTAKDF